MYDGGNLGVQQSSSSPHHQRRARLKIDQITIVFRGFLAYLRDQPDRCQLAVADQMPGSLPTSSPNFFSSKRQYGVSRIAESSRFNQ